jgi:hypothetical protein
MKSSKNKIIGRRGIFTKNLQAEDKLGNVTHITCEIEVEEIESTDTKSKIKILSIISDRSQYNTQGYKKEIMNMVNKTWILSNNIEWINNSKSSIRANKINEILN